MRTFLSYFTLHSIYGNWLFSKNLNLPHVIDTQMFPEEGKKNKTQNKIKTKAPKAAF